MSPTKHVLVKLSADGFVEVFADADIVATVINVPGPSNAAEEVLVEELVDHILPAPYRKIHEPGSMVCNGQFDEVNLDDLKATVTTMQALNNLGDLNRQKFKNVKEIGYARLGGGGGKRANTCPTEKRKNTTQDKPKQQRSDKWDRLAQTME